MDNTNQEPDNYNYQGNTTPEWTGNGNPTVSNDSSWPDNFTLPNEQPVWNGAQTIETPTTLTDTTVASDRPDWLGFGIPPENNSATIPDNYNYQGNNTPEWIGNGNATTSTDTSMPDNFTPPTNEQPVWNGAQTSGSATTGLQSGAVESNLGKNTILGAAYSSADSNVTGTFNAGRGSDVVQEYSNPQEGYAAAGLNGTAGNDYNGKQPESSTPQNGASEKVFTGAAVDGTTGDSEKTYTQATLDGTAGNGYYEKQPGSGVSKTGFTDTDGEQIDTMTGEVINISRAGVSTISASGKVSTSVSGSNNTILSIKNITTAQLDLDTLASETQKLYTTVQEWETLSKQLIVYWESETTKHADYTEGIEKCSVNLNNVCLPIIKQYNVAISNCLQALKNTSSRTTN